MLMFCDDIPTAVKCASVSRKKMQKLAMHAGGGTNDHGEKRNVLIVSVLLLIGSNQNAAQQYVAAHLNPEGATGTRSAARLDDPNLSWAMLRSKTKLFETPAPGLISNFEDSCVSLDFGVGSSWLRWHPQGPESNSGRWLPATSNVMARFPRLFPIRNPCEIRGLYRRSDFGPRTCGRSINHFSSKFSHFRGLRDALEYKLWGLYRHSYFVRSTSDGSCIQDHHHERIATHVVNQPTAV